MTKPTLELVSESRCFDGRQLVYRHASTACACTMRFAVYLPPAAEKGPVPALYWLSGLTCTAANFTDAAQGVLDVLTGTRPAAVANPGWEKATATLGST